jgi:putative copper export protein/copper(I)-binding protein
MLVFQVTTAAGVPFPTGIVGVDLGSYLLNTVHGRLWLMRTSLWFFIGTLLDMRRVRLSLWGALILSAALTLTHSLFSHAAAAEDQIAAVAGTWLHLMVSSLWIGGLVAFAFTLWQQRHDRNAQAVGQMIAHFSNYARIGVAGLVLTGAYAGWLHVGSPDGLLNTVYGRALLIKLALFLPLLVLAAYNLFFTARGLARGEEIWVGRLRSLVRAEIALAALILVAAAVLTAVPPSRTVLNARAAVPVLPEINPYEAVEVAGAVSYHLEIDPGFVGENTFIVAPFDANGSPITDVSRIRLRFDNLDQPSGQSELRPEAQDGAVGLFTASGTNLSTPGRWRVRMTVQRPDEFDQVVDYQVNVSAPPSLVIPEIDPSLPLDQRWLLAALTALGLIGIGVVGAVAFTERLYRLNLRILLPMMLLVVGMIFAASAVTPFARASVQPTARDAWVLPALESGTAAVYLTIENPGVLPERLIGASTEVAERVEIHEDMVMEEVAHMMWHSSVEIPAGGTLVLAQDDAAHGYHLMLTVLTRDLKEGEGFPLTLRFENGRTITTEVTVRLPLD